MKSDLLTVDELAVATGLTVRTTRYYASLGLLPPPERKGRMAYYGPQHQARLELVRSLQDHGFTLSAIEGFLADIAMDATPDEIALRRTLLTSGTPLRWEVLTREELETKAGRRLSKADLDWLRSAGALVPRRGGEFEVVPFLDLALELRDLDFPLQVVKEANQVVRTHMDALVGELDDLLNEKVPRPYEDEARLLTTLRRLSLEATITGFHRAYEGRLKGD